MGRPRTPSVREAGPPGAVVSALASSALALAAVVGLVAGLNLAFGSAATPDDRGQAAEHTDPGRDPGPDLGTTSPDEDGAADPRPTPTAAAGPDGDAAEAGPAAPPSVEVVVLNQTSRRGLAADFRGALAKAGWNPGTVGNFHGTVPATTVYYGAGLKSEAQALNRAFAEVHRVRPAFDGIPEDKLTVILCKDYPPS